MIAKTSALEFAERGNFSQIRAFAGDVLYTERMPADNLYVVKEGEVDLYLVRDEKRTVIETLRKGQCFGVATHLNTQLRSHNAAARSYCELYLIGNETLNAAIEGSADLVRSMLDTISQRLTTAHELIATRVNYRPDLLIYAQLLYLLGMAEVGRNTVRAPGQGPQLARPLVTDVVTNARLMFGHSDKHIRACLGKLLTLHLIRIEDGNKGNGKQVVFAPRDIVSQAQRITQTDVDGDKLTYEYIGVDEFSALVEVDRSLLLRKLAAGEFAEDIFTFRRAEILRVLDEKGKRYFVERKMKTPSEFREVGDLEFADTKSIFAAVSKLDTFDIAKILSTLEETSAVRSKMLNALSRRRREEVESDLKDMGPVDPMEAQLIGTTLVTEVKGLMLSAQG